MPRTTPPPGAPPHSSWNVYFGVAEPFDVAAVRDFYVGLLGWDCEASKVPIPGDIQYLEYGVGGTRYRGILPMTAEWGELPPRRSDRRRRLRHPAESGLSAASESILPGGAVAP